MVFLFLPGEYFYCCRLATTCLSNRMRHRLANGRTLHIVIEPTLVKWPSLLTVFLPHRSFFMELLRVCIASLVFSRGLL